MREEKLIRKAEFDPKVCQYWLLSGTLILAISVVGIPLLLLWIPLGLIFTKRYLQSMECILTTRSLKVKRGIFVRNEKTVPLDKITDLGMTQGPIMRRMGLERVTVETAGQSSPTGGALIALTGIIEAKTFRETVLRQKDLLIEPEPTSKPSEEDATQILGDIKQSLLRIERLLEEK